MTDREREARIRERRVTLIEDDPDSLPDWLEDVASYAGEGPVQDRLLMAGERLRELQRLREIEEAARGHIDAVDAVETGHARDSGLIRRATETRDRLRTALAADPHTEDGADE